MIILITLFKITQTTLTATPILKTDEQKGSSWPKYSINTIDEKVFHVLVRLCNYQCFNTHV